MPRRRHEHARIYCLCALASSACTDGSSDTSSEQGCPEELVEVALDTRFGDESSGYETPRQVIELLERPVTGTLTWSDNENNEYLDVSGASGTTTFHAQATAGPTLLLRPGVVGMGGVPQARITCGTELIFDVSVHLETEDGALAEDWQGRGTYGVSGTLGGHGSIGVEIEDPPPFMGTLRVTERPGVSEAWEERRFRILLVVATYPLDFVGMAGTMQYFLMNEGDGEGIGVENTIAELAWPVDETTGG